MVTVAHRRTRSTTRVVVIVAVALLTALVALQVTLYLTERIGKGAKTPAAAADAYLSALQRGDTGKIDDLTFPSGSPNRQDCIDTVIREYGGLRANVVKIEDTESSGSKVAFIHGELAGKRIDARVGVERTRNRWFVTGLTTGP